MKKISITFIFVLIAHLSYSQVSFLDSLNVSPELWRMTIARLTISADTLRCKTTKTTLYRSGNYRDEIVYTTRTRIFRFRESDILKWCARKEGL